MTRYDYKLLALDMDGTLLNDDHQVSEETANWIRRAIKEGFHVCLSTGRAAVDALPYAVELGLETPMITVNGSEVWKAPHELHYRALMDVDSVRKMHALAEEYGVWFWAYTTERMYNRDRWAETLDDKEWLKFGYNTKDHDVLHEILMRLQNMGGLQITNSSPDNLEINPEGISKASGIAQVCELLDITMEQVIAVGDSLNDIAAIQAVGLGVAMGNAQEPVKEVADLVVASNNEDGIVQVIREYMLNGMEYEEAEVGTTASTFKAPASKTRPEDNPSA
ncbi:Cof-type HAD-IIB family hydrolase [Saccharibacillus kuerlensis]|uniref:5-amino-6-(5-phospho-D-ribitylamino)uracil phosphatase YcsE n=1 Tax=Saccharibacillus kuerlensis TaxID=459527 RepID=A0ABQ2L4K3_9BACL|nr:Cof-type HAD-IIB family hydrolase [Saccharibacillus kuerlensis]GGO02476.1 5-amino-6-(5-phospho-D-ribitylamino)uracil phosphatase YcsE [Saccharibacillus kuerlensis]